MPVNVRTSLTAALCAAVTVLPCAAMAAAETAPAASTAPAAAASASPVPSPQSAASAAPAMPAPAASASAAPPVDHRIPFGGGRATMHYPRVHEYQLDFVKIVSSFDEVKGDVFGDTTNTITLIEPLRGYVDFDSQGLRYSWVGIAGGKTLPYRTFGQTLRVTIPATYGVGAKIAIEAKYSAHPDKGVYFVRPDKFYPTRPWEVWSQGEMVDNHSWFPIYDWPDMKAPSETVTTVPEGQVVVSNGRLVSQTTDAKAHTTTFDWLESVPHSTYLISIVAGTFAESVDHLGSLPVTYYAPPADKQTVAYDFRATPKMIAFFDWWNGVPFAYDKYAQSAVVDFTYGGMENISATTQTSSTLHDQRAELDGDSEGLVSHELAHQWWGDLETLQDWGQVWVNEGYATYYEALYREHAHGEDAFDMDRLGMMAAVFRQDQEYRRPVVTEDYADPIDMFDADGYQKPGLFLHMTRTILGTDLYRKAMTALLEQYRAKNLNTAEWEASVEKTTGRDLHWFVDEWLYKAGWPEYAVSYAYDDAAKAIHLTVDQTQSTAWDTPAVFTMPIVVEVKTADQDTRTTIQDDQRDQEFDIPADSQPLMVLFDPGHNILSQVTFPKSDDAWTYQMKNAGSVLDRLIAAQTLIGGSKPDDDEIAAAGWFLKNEPFPDARASIISSFAALAPDTRAEAAIAGALSDPSAHVRSAAALALSDFPSDSAAIVTLKQLAASDPSYATIAGSVRTLADWHAPDVDPILAQALTEPSNNGIIAGAALLGYAEMEKAGAIPLEEKYARYGAPLDSRGTAIRALGRIGKGHPDVTTFLTGLLGDPSLFTNFTILQALGTVGDPAALPAVERLAVTTTDVRLQQFALATAKMIKAANQPGHRPGAGSGM
jgi:aminopeptidase N